MMILNKNEWEKEDRSLFLEYLKTFGREEKKEWAKNILQTESPVLAMLTKDIVNVVNEIMKGNYLSYLDLEITDYYETIAIYGSIISKLNSLDTFLIYLNKYLNFMNCWAHCDLLHFPLIYEKKEIYLNLSRKFRKDDRVMVRRLSLFILFQFVKEKEFLNNILDSIIDFKDENEYYVIMMAGWLLSECIILYKDETLAFITSNSLNKKIINKAIQKCRESNRLSKEEKDFLLSYKIK